ncbi:MAG TPA: hypothetical protein VLU94_01190 [Candidatus Nitrosotalea sp.]|nr:hypothetical protein [Candidatus Nitrosotalea sp.]
MIRPRLSLILRNVAAAILCAGFIPAVVQASFQYNPRDLILGLRQSGGISELTVNVGQVSNYYALPPGTSITVTNLSTNQLTAAFPNLNNLSWSVSGAIRTNDDVSYPIQTLWISEPRTDINVQSVPWVRKSQLSQGNVAAVAYAIGEDGLLYGNSQPAGPNNTATGVIIPSGDPYSYGASMGPDGDFAGAFQGVAENTTPANFSTAGTPVRSDLYELKPGSGATLNTPGTYLGYFDFRTNGTLTFTAAGGSVPPPSPTITAITRSGNLTTISFTTTAGASYSLRYTDSAGLPTPIANWSVGGGSTVGDGNVQSLQDSSADGGRYYVISVIPVP